MLRSIMAFGMSANATAVDEYLIPKLRMDGLNVPPNGLFPQKRADVQLGRS